MLYSASHITYWDACWRKLWLFHNEIILEHENEAVLIGRLIHKEAYRNRPKKYKELDLGIVKLDQYDPKLGVIHEMKKSPKLEHIHILQLKYYLWIAEQTGMKANKGILEYPKYRRTKEINLSDEDREKFPIILKEIQQIVASPHCPPLIRKTYCKTCAYHDFCYSQ